MEYLWLVGKPLKYAFFNNIMKKMDFLFDA